MEQLLLQLDTRTLAFVSGLAGLLLAATMLGIAMTGTRHRALYDWAAAGLCYGFGFLIGVWISVPWPPWVSAAFANALVGSGHVLVLAGVQRHLGRRVWAPLLLVLVVALLLSTLLLEPFRAELRLRVLVHSALYCAVDLTAGVLLWRAAAPGLTAYRRAVALLAILNGAAIAWRFGHALLAERIENTLVDNPFNIALFLVSMAQMFMLTMALAVMLFRGKAVQLQWIGQHDPMTGMLNRRSLLEHAQREVARSLRYGTPLSLLMLDIDRFKAINDHAGHEAGDEVIRRVAARIGEGLRASDTAFRLGGEEFLMLLPATSVGAAMQVAERLRAAISALPPAGGRPVTASIGVTEVMPRVESWEDAMRRVDGALYRAKHEGRDRSVAIAHPAEQALAASAARLAEVG